MPRWILRPFAAFFCALGFIGGGVLALLVYIETPHGSVEVADAIFRDRYAAYTQIIIMGAGLLTVFVSYSARMRQDHIGEYYALLVTAGAGMAFLVQSANLMTLFLGLEWFSVCLYILCAIETDLVGSLEAGLKYLIIGGMGSAVLLFGSALIYGATGELGFSAIADATRTQNLSGDPLLLVGLAMLLAGLAFKSSAAPFHMWTPDVYEGAPTPVTGFMAAATKTVALVLMYRVLTVAFPEERDVWTIAVAVLAVISLAWGNIAALVQSNVKRLLAYSSISHAGFMLIAVSSANALGVRALLYYLIPYSAISIGAFAVVVARERELGEPVTLDEPRRLRLGAAAARVLDGDVHARLRRFPADRWVHGQVPRLLVRVGGGLELARDRRRARDARQPLLLPRCHKGDVHAAGRGARAGADRRLAAARDHALERGVHRDGRERGRILRRAAARRLRAQRGGDATALGEGGHGPLELGAEPEQRLERERRPGTPTERTPSIRPRRPRRAGAAPRRRAAPGATSAGSNRLSSSSPNIVSAVAATIGTATSSR